MRIENVNVVVSHPGRNYLTVVVRTVDGTIGLGDGTLNGRELAVAAYLRDHVVPTLIGRSADRIEDTWQFLYRGAYWRGGPVAMAAIAAIDTALWDIKAKQLGVPLYQLLGGRSRDGCLSYGHASGRDASEVIDSALALIESGFSAVRLQLGLAGEPREAPAGSRGGMPYESRWDAATYMRQLPRLFERARAELGSEVHLLHDAHHRLRPVEAVRLARDLEPYRLFWFEDPVQADNYDGLRLIRAQSSTALAAGEVLTTIAQTRTIVQEQLIDYVRTSVTHAGGVTALRRIADFASVYQVRTGFHGPDDISPIGFSAALHLAYSVHNFGIQEYAGYDPLALEAFSPQFMFDNGFLRPGETPGLGVDFDEVTARDQPYEREYLPINRLIDGTLHEW